MDRDRDAEWVNLDGALRGFPHIVKGPAKNVRLDAAALLMSCALTGRSIAVPGYKLLDDFAELCPERTFSGLRAYLFDELGFAGDSEDYDAPRNSFLDVVMERRRGLPIMLAILMIEVGRRMDVPVLGIGMPMHFLVRDANDTDAFVDPFTGQPLTRAEAKLLFESMSQGRIPWSAKHLHPTPARMIVARMLANVRGSYERRNDQVAVAIIAGMQARIPELGEAAVEEAARLYGIFN